jgi:hypothetical protein
MRRVALFVDKPVIGVTALVLTHDLSPEPVG